MPKKIVLFPFGGNAREAFQAIADINKIKKEWDVIGFIDDDEKKWRQAYGGVRVVGGRDWLNKHADVCVLAVQGNPSGHAEREGIIARLNVKPARFARVIHPTVCVASDAQIGYNTLVLANTVVSAAAVVGNHCVILQNSVISHDARIGDYCCIGTNVSVSGFVTIGAHSYIGSGTSIRDHIRIGPKTLVGLGSNVVKHLGSNKVYAGNPAKELKTPKS